MKKAIVIFFIAVFILSLTFSSISCKQEAKEEATGGGVLGYIAISQPIDEARQAVWMSVQRWAGVAGLMPVFGDGKYDVNTQSEVIDNYIAQKVDAILIQPIDSAGIVPAIKRANDAGIPVFTFVVKAEAGCETVLTSTMNNITYGKLAGERLVELLTEKYGEPKGKVLELTGIMAMTDAQDRDKGFQDVLAQYPDIEILQKVCDWDSQKAFAAVQDTFAANPDIDAIYSHTGSMTEGIVSALESAGKLKPSGDADHVIYCSVDGFSRDLQRIRDGFIDSISDSSVLDLACAVNWYKDWKAGNALPKPGDKIDKIEGQLWTPAFVEEGPSGPILNMNSYLIDKTNVDDPNHWGNVKG